MWVRSQDKKHLYKSFGFEIVNNSIYCLFGNTVANVGTYSSEEKALKVLDMIHARMNKLNNTRSNANSVYAMPQDEEVNE